MAARAAGKKKGGGNTAIGKLEGAVDRLLAELQEARTNATALASLASESGDPADVQALAMRIKALEGENQDLRERLSSGRGIAESLVAKIRFLEEKK